MADVLRIKRRPAGGAAGGPTLGTLAGSELAFNETDNTLYYGKGNSGGLATSILPIAGPGAFLPLTGGQLSGGLSFGQRFAPEIPNDPNHTPDPTNTKNHISLYDDWAGFSITGGLLNMVASHTVVLRSDGNNVYPMVPLLLSRDPPVAGNEAATKNYVDGLTSGGPFLPISGGTVNGNLTVTNQMGVYQGLTVGNGTAPAFITMMTNNGGNAGMGLYANGHARWQLSTDAWPESGGQLGAGGAGFAFYTFNNDGSWHGTALTIARDTWHITAGETMEVARDPQAAMEVATRQYVDNHVPAGGPFLPLSAGSGYPLTGALYAPNMRVSQAGLGYLELAPGTASNSGYVAFFNAAGTRLGYIGYADNTTMSFNVENGLTVLSLNAPLVVAPTFQSNNIYDTGLFRADGLSTLYGGLSFGNNQGSSVTDLSQHITLFPGYGFNVTPGQLNYNGAAHAFIIGGAQRALIDNTSLSVLGNVYAAGSVQAALGPMALTLLPNGGGYNPITVSGDNMIISQSGVLGAGTMTMTIWGNNPLGIRIAGATDTIALTANGEMTVSHDPTSALGIATRQYVLNNAISIASGDARWVNVTGDGMSGGLNFGSEAVSSATDLTRHLALFAYQYGFSITGSRLNYVVPGGAAHSFIVDATQRATMDDIGLTVWGSGTFYGGNVSASAFQASGSFGSSVALLPGMGPGSYNPIVQSGDAALFTNGGGPGTGATVMTVWSDTPLGIRVAGPTNTIALTASGEMTVSHDPTSALGIVTRQYLEANTTTIAAGDARWVNLDGDTMTGNLTVGSIQAGASLTLGGNATQFTSFIANGSNDSFRDYRIATNGKTRWAFGGATNIHEPGDDSGTDFVLQRYYDNGSFNDAIFSVQRVDGSTIFGHQLSVNAMLAANQFWNNGQSDLWGMVNARAGLTVIAGDLTVIGGGIDLNYAASNNAQDMTRGIRLWGSPTSGYGFVVTGATLNYNVVGGTSSHDFYADAALLFRIQGGVSTRSYLPMFAANYIQVDAQPGNGATVVLNAAVGTGAVITAYRASSPRWSIGMVASDESGDPATGTGGSSFVLSTWDNGGHFLGQPFYITRGPGGGDGVFTGNLYVSQDPWQDTSVVTLRYLRANYLANSGGPYLATAGGTMLGQLNIANNTALALKDTSGGDLRFVIGSDNHFGLYSTGSSGASNVVVWDFYVHQDAPAQNFWLETYFQRFTHHQNGLSWAGGDFRQGSIYADGNWGGLFRGLAGNIADIAFADRDGNIPLRVVSPNKVQIVGTAELATVSVSGDLTVTTGQTNVKRFVFSEQNPGAMPPGGYGALTWNTDGGGDVAFVNGCNWASAGFSWYQVLNPSGWKRIAYLDAGGVMHLGGAGVVYTLGGSGTNVMGFSWSGGVVHAAVDGSDQGALAMQSWVQANTVNIAAGDARWVNLDGDAMTGMLTMNAGSDSIRMVAPSGSARYVSVTGARTWSAGTWIDGSYAIGDETAAQFRLTIDTTGNTTLGGDLFMNSNAIRFNNGGVQNSISQGADGVGDTYNNIRIATWWGVGIYNNVNAGVVPQNKAGIWFNARDGVTTSRLLVLTGDGVSYGVAGGGDRIGFAWTGSAVRAFINGSGAGDLAGQSWVSANFAPLTGAGYLPLAGGTMLGPIVMTGVNTAPTPDNGVSNSQIATTAFVSAAITAAGSISEAPSDNQYYSRRNAAWAVTPGGLADAPVDAFVYGRGAGAWARVLPLTGGTMQGGISFGQLTDSGNTSMSNHIVLHTNGFGFGVTTDGRLNYNVDAGGQHSFLTAGTDRLTINASNTTANTNLIAIGTLDARSWIRVALNTNAPPPVDNAGYISWNRSQGGGEVNFYNAFNGGGGNAFDWRQVTGAGTEKLIASLHPNGTFALAGVGIYYNGVGGANAMGFKWDGAAVHAYVDGGDQGTLAFQSWVGANYLSTSAGGNYVLKAGDTMSGSLSVWAPQNDTTAQLYLYPYGGVNGAISKIRFGGTFQATNGDMGVRLVSSIRSGFASGVSGAAWGYEYLDIWVNNGGANDANSDANQVRVGRFTKDGLTVNTTVTLGRDPSADMEATTRRWVLANAGGVTVLNSITQLQALNSTANYVFVTGYYNSGDGGGGDYVRGPNGTDNGGSIIQTGNGTFYLQTYGAPVSVKQFGARGNNSADDQAAINNAFAAGTDIKFPAGTYRASQPLNIVNHGTHVTGVGRDSTRIVATNSSAPAIVIATNVTSVTIEQLTVDRSVTAAGGGDGISAPFYAQFVRLSNLIVQNQWKGLHLGPTGYSYAENVIAIFNLDDGFYWSNTASNGAVQWSLNNCLSTQNVGHGFYILATPGPGAVALGEMVNCSTYANGITGFAAVGQSNCPINGLRITGGFFGGDGNSEVYLDTWGGDHKIIGTYTELAGTSPTGPTMSIPASHAGNGFEITVNNTDILCNDCHSEGHSNAGFVTSAAEAQFNGCKAINNGASTSPGRVGFYQLAGRATFSNVRSGNIRGSVSQQYGIYLNNATVGVLIWGADLTGNSTATLAVAAGFNNVTMGGVVPAGSILLPHGGITVGTPVNGVIDGGINVASGIQLNGTSYNNP
jgi:hypothetical protein